MTDKPGISMVVVNWNTRDSLRACLKSIYATMDDIAFEAIVVYNASSDHSADVVQSEFPDAQVIRNEANLGFAYRRKHGKAWQSPLLRMLSYFLLAVQMANEPRARRGSA